MIALVLIAITTTGAIVAGLNMRGVQREKGFDFEVILSICGIGILFCFFVVAVYTMIVEIFLEK